MTWQEELHPRDDAGRFAPGEGGGAWTRVAESRQLPNREKRHEKLKGKTLAPGIPSEAPRVTMLGGGAASGKSTMIRSGFLETQEGSVHVDPDELKMAMPEFRQMVDVGGETAKQAGGFVHEEGSQLSKDILREAIGLSYPVLYDSTGDGSYENLAGKVADMRATYAEAYPDRPPLPIDAVYLTRDVEAAVADVHQRFLDTGRYVDEEIVAAQYRDIPPTVSRAVDERLYDNFRLYTADGGMRIIAEYRERGELVIHDQAEWSKFYVGTG